MRLRVASNGAALRVDLSSMRLPIGGLAGTTYQDRFNGARTHRHTRTYMHTHTRTHTHTHTHARTASMVRALVSRTRVCSHSSTTTATTTTAATRFPGSVVAHDTFGTYVTSVYPASTDVAGLVVADLESAYAQTGAGVADVGGDGEGRGDFTDFTCTLPEDPGA
jgi:hypothetical protein